MDKKDFPEDYFWPQNKEKIYDHFDDLERLWNSHVSDFELIKKWMALPITEALSMLMEADALMTRMGNRIEYIKTTAVAFFLIGRLREMQQQCQCFKNFIDEMCNSLNYKEEEKTHRHFYSRDIPFKRPETLFDGIIPDQFDSDRVWYEPMSLDSYSLIIRNITNRVNTVYLSLERFTSYVLEAKEDIENETTDYGLMDDIERFRNTNIYKSKRQELLDQIPHAIKSKGRESCMEWLRKNELLRYYNETRREFSITMDDISSITDVKNIDKTRNAIILKSISSGLAEWGEFLTYLTLYDEFSNGLCPNEDNRFTIVDEIEASIHPKLQKEIYESYIKAHPDESLNYQSKHKHFPHYLNKEQGMYLFRILVRGCYIDATTDESSFLFLLGCTHEQPNELKKIKWIKNKQLLREMLEQLYEALVENRSLRKVDLKELTPLCFVNKKGNEMRLANRKAIYSIESDYLQNEIATLLRAS